MFGKVLKPGSYKMEDISTFLQSREAKHRYFHQKANRQIFFWQNEFEQQPDEYLLDAIVYLNLKDSIQTRSYKLAECLLHEGILKRNKQKFKDVMYVFPSEFQTKKFLNK